jgi:hypothetical protein
LPTTNERCQRSVATVASSRSRNRVLPIIDEIGYLPMSREQDHAHVVLFKATASDCARSAGPACWYGSTSPQPRSRAEARLGTNGRISFRCPIRAPAVSVFDVR